mgnify:CR=1 FL=1
MFSNFERKFIKIEQTATWKNLDKKVIIWQEGEHTVSTLRDTH